MEIHPLLKEIFAKKSLVEATFSAPNRGKIKPVEIKNQRLYQITQERDNKAYHRNVSGKEALQLILDELLPGSKEVIFYTTEGDYHIIHGKIHRKKGTKILENTPHNRVKKSPLLPEPLPFLVELGVMKPHGGLVPAKADKFRQINRFLELVRDVLPSDGSEPLHIIDFGCGKGYLTFALYHWLTENQNRKAMIYGLDLKKDVIENLQTLAAKLGYKHLYFEACDIKDFKPTQKVDMVIALHACNTATDMALHQAVQWGADVILAAPCCHQELYSQIQNDQLNSLLQHGILREKLAALATDALRADLLEMEGYKTQIIEFVDPEHTPKNLLIRAVKGTTPARLNKARERYAQCKNALHAAPLLEKLLLK